MKQLPQISQAEWQVMEVLWSRPQPLTANEVIERLDAKSDWKPNTVRTLLARLAKKGAVHVRVEGKSFFYSPCFSRQEHVNGESESFLSRIFGGTARGLLVHFAESGRLSKADLDELKQILKRKKE